MAKSKTNTASTVEEKNTTVEVETPVTETKEETVKEEVQEKASKKEYSKIVDNVKGQVECDKNLIFSYYSVSDNYSEISLDDFIELIPKPRTCKGVGAFVLNGNQRAE